MRHEYRTEDKSGWGEGPWQDEPDKVVWVDEATGLDCMIHRNRVGALCGYVGVPTSHPWYGLNYDVVDDVDVHGGLTYSNACNPDASEEEGICHVPEDGRPDEVWWLGFDCIHFNDLAPGMRADELMMAQAARERGDITTAELFERVAVQNTHYWTIPQVTEEVESLAQQAAAA